MPSARRSQEPTVTSKLAKRVPLLEVNPNISLTKYYMASSNVLRQADQYRRAKNDVELYVLLMRYASLIMETIPKHPHFRKDDSKYQSLLLGLQHKYLNEMEGVKVLLNLNMGNFSLGGPAPERRAQPPHARHTWAAPMARMDWQGTAGMQPTGGEAVPGPSLESPLPCAPPLPAGFDLPPPASSPVDTSLPDFTRPGMRQASAAALAKHSLYISAAPAPPPPAAPGSGAPSAYPTLDVGGEAAPPAADPFSGPISYPSLDTTPISLPDAARPLPAQPPPPPPGEPTPAQLDAMANAPPAHTPVLPPQEMPVDTSYAPPTGPPPPGATCCDGPAATAVAPPEGGVKQYERLKGGLRDVHVSESLMEDFYRFAISNTRKGVESCGILAGSLSESDGVFTISMLIIPKQKGTTDTVEALNEDEIFEVQFSRGVYPLGWIHTHPTQTCFLSSVDVHTQVGYQIMLDEAVAIVMAPRDPKTRCGIFRLTTPGGLDMVQKCTKRGFHPHPRTHTGQEIYERVGHVWLNEGAAHEVVDLR